MTSAANTTAIVTGAGGQDGYFLVDRLLSEGSFVHAVVRNAAQGERLSSLMQRDHLAIHELDITDTTGYTTLIDSIEPDEFYNLAGLSTVRRSFEDPTAAWRSNAHAVQGLLDAVRLRSPMTRFYQSSSTDMFGSFPDESTFHDESSRFLPQSPYAAAKAAAHLLCDAYRRTFDLRIACGILSNHESHRRPAGFLTRELVDHVRQLRGTAPSPDATLSPLKVGNLAAKRDWGFAPDYVDGIVRIARQIEVRAATRGTSPEDDTAANYRDYVLGSGRLHAVWELIDRAFLLAGFPLTWDRSAQDPADWSARLESTGALAVTVDRKRLRPSDPPAIGANARRARQELGWRPREGLDVFLLDMLNAPRDEVPE